MAWTTPKTFVPNVKLTAAELNTYLSDNTLYLYQNLPVTLLTTRGDLLTRDATGLIRLGIGASGRYLRSNGTDPAWSTLLASDLTYSGLTAGQYLRASGATAAAFAALLFSDLTYSGLTTGQVPRATGATSVAFGALDLANANAVTGTLPAGNLPLATTAARGAIIVGNDLAISSGTVNRNKGTSFPVSPATNDLFYRTDRGLEYYYDGTRWLTTCEYSLPIGTLVGNTGSPVSTTYVVMPTTYAPYFTNVVTSVRVITTNNGTNFWTITLQSIDNGFTTNDNVININTSAYAVNTYVVTNNTPAVPAPTNRTHYRISVTKTLSPGAIDIACHAYYRLIG